MLQNFYLILIGILAGILAGFFGIGGGLILIPFLVLALGFPQHMANGTSLVALLAPVGIFGVLEYYKAGKISPDNIKAGLIIAVGMLAGVYLGSRGALLISSTVLRKSFAIFLLLVAIRMWFANSAGK
jgi:uncharacterized membrane protein YfcA